MHEALTLTDDATVHLARRLALSIPASRCPHTSAYVSVRQRTSAYVSIRQHTQIIPQTRLRNVQRLVG
jgi:hypothetical protein